MTKSGLTAPPNVLESAPENLSEIERTLGAALRDFASELRLADAADFAAFIRIGHMANLQSLVQSSAELYFKPGTLELAEPGELELGWSQPPLDNAAHEVPPRRGACVFPAPAGGGFGRRRGEVDYRGERRHRRGFARKPAGSACKRALRGPEPIPGEQLGVADI